jgi:hypothetical protein
MKVQSFKRISTDNISAEYKQLAEKLAYSINPFAEDVVTALDGRLSIAENLNQSYKEITVQVNSSGVPIQATQIKSDITGRAKGMNIEFIENQTNINVFPTAAPFITWTENEGIITVRHITGLQTGNKWKLRLLIKGE